jgi:hypothetical protein
MDPRIRIRTKISWISNTGFWKLHLDPDPHKSEN